MTRGDIVALIDRRNAAYDRRDIDALTALHAEDGVVESLLAGVVTGRPAIGEIYRTWLTAFPDVQIKNDDLIVDGDRAVQASILSGTDQGGLMGLPASQKPFRLPMVHIYTFGDGSITHERRIYDFTGLLVQIGVLKAKPA